MIVIVTGGRDYSGPGLVLALDNLHGPDKRIDWLILGDCPRGADRIAWEWSRAPLAPLTVVYRAIWADGPKAGPERNQRMVMDALRLQNDGDGPILCLAAPGWRGTADCTSRARKAGVEVQEVK